MTPGEIAYDTNAGHARLWSIVLEFVKQGADVGYFGIWPLAHPKYALALSQAGVEVLAEQGPMSELSRPAAMTRKGHEETARRFREAVVQFAPTHVYLYLHYTGGELLDLARESAPGALLVLDAVDVLFRQHWPDGSTEPYRTEAAELSLYRRCDMVIVDSHPDAEALRSRELATPVHVVPLAYRPRCGPSYSDRRGVLFVGTSSHPPNVDAAQWFVQAVLPVAEQVMPIPTTIVGADEGGLYDDLVRPNVTTLGWTPDLDSTMDAHRLAVAPLRTGGGLRGKVLEALSAGLPVVTTDVAAYGIPEPSAGEVIGGGVPAHPNAFARALVDLYSDEARWTSQRDAGLRLIRGHFGAKRLRESVAGVLGYAAHL